MCEAVEQCRGHLGVAKYAGPFAEAEIGGDDHTGPLVEFAQQMEQQCAARCAERQVTQFIENDEIGVGKPMPKVSSFLDKMLKDGTPVVSLTFWFRDRQVEASREGSGLRGGAALYYWSARKA